MVSDNNINTMGNQLRNLFFIGGTTIRCNNQIRQLTLLTAAVQDAINQPLADPIAILDSVTNQVLQLRLRETKVIPQGII